MKGQADLTRGAKRECQEYLKQIQEAAAFLGLIPGVTHRRGNRNMSTEDRGSRNSSNSDCDSESGGGAGGRSPRLSSGEDRDLGMNLMVVPNSTDGGSLSALSTDTEEDTTPQS